jgi:hypothetical protein
MHCTLDDRQWLRHDGLSSDDHNIHAGGEMRVFLANGFAQEPPHSVANSRFAQAFANDKSVPVMRKLILREAQRHQPKADLAPCLSQVVEVAAVAQSEPLLHPESMDVGVSRRSS